MNSTQNRQKLSSRLLIERKWPMANSMVWHLHCSWCVRLFSCFSQTNGSSSRFGLNGSVVWMQLILFHFIEWVCFWCLSSCCGAKQHYRSMRTQWDGLKSVRIHSIAFNRNREREWKRQRDPVVFDAWLWFFAFCFTISVKTPYKLKAAYFCYLSLLLLLLAVIYRTTEHRIEDPSISLSWILCMQITCHFI